LIARASLTGCIKSYLQTKSLASRRGSATMPPH
jgi:hypothetical protein